MPLVCCNLADDGRQTLNSSGSPLFSEIVRTRGREIGPRMVGKIIIRSQNLFVAVTSDQSEGKAIKALRDLSRNVITQTSLWTKSELDTKW